MLRYLHGVKADTRRAPLPARTRFDLRYKGQVTDIAPTADGLGYQIRVVPQVGFPIRGRKGVHKYFRLDGLEAALQDSTIDRSEVQVVVSDPQDAKKVEEALAASGLQPKRRSRRPPALPDAGLADIEVHELQDISVKRCMAKIAFNYLAYVISQQCNGRTEWLMSPQFDRLRGFVLGTQLGWEPRFVLADIHLRPLAGKVGRRQGVAHRVVLQWKRRVTEIAATVELFSWLCCQITLVEGFTDVALNVTSGHVWDVQTKLAGAMQVVRKSLLPS